MAIERCQSGAALRRRTAGLTLVEMLVSVSLLLVIMVAVAQIFASAGKMSGLMIDHGTVLGRVTAIGDVLREDLEQIDHDYPLVIASKLRPGPILSGAPNAFPHRRIDTISFCRTDGTLVTFGAAVRGEVNGGGVDAPGWDAYPAAEWVLGRRVVQLNAGGGVNMIDDGSGYPVVSPDEYLPRLSTNLATDTVGELQDHVTDAPTSNYATFRLGALAGIAYGATPPVQPQYLRAPVLTPRGNENLFSLNLVENCAEVIIEWTTGRYANPAVGPASGLAWYGRTRDVNHDGVLQTEQGDVMPYVGWLAYNRLPMDRAAGGPPWGHGPGGINRSARRIYLAERWALPVLIDLIPVGNNPNATLPEADRTEILSRLAGSSNDPSFYYIAAWDEWNVPEEGPPTAIRVTIRLFGPTQRNREGYTYSFVVNL